MPHLAFYATADDIALIMEFVLQECRVFESFSVPDSPLRSLTSPLEVRDAFEQGGPGGLGLMLHAPAMKGELVVERFQLKPNAIPGKSWRENISGWGLIHMEFNAPHGTTLWPSFTNHNSESRARAWEPTYPQLPPVAAWDFREVARISRRINRHIAGLGIRKEGPRPILPGVEAMVKAGSIVLGTKP